MGKVVGTYDFVQDAVDSLMGVDQDHLLLAYMGNDSWTWSYCINSLEQLEAFREKITEVLDEIEAEMRDEDPGNYGEFS